MIELVIIFGPRVLWLWTHGFDIFVQLLHWLYLMHIISGEEVRCQARKIKESAGGKKSLGKWEITYGL